MRTGLLLTLAAGLLTFAACGDEEQPAAEPDSGISGLVHLGPQCPVVTQDDPCEDQPAADVTVIVSEQLPGEAYAAGKEVARTTTAADGTFTVAVAPGEYVVTAEAGMFCELMDARVLPGKYAEVDVPCDTGIR
jgi:hypothetical protein